MAFMRSLLFLTVYALEITSGTLHQEQFKNFVQEFKKNYDSEEEFNYRLSVFSKNMEQANRLQREELGTAQYGVTKFSDLTDEEFATYYLNPVNALPPDDLAEYEVESPPTQKSCDWRKAGVISPAKDQGQCGSCWVFAAVANIEALWAIRGYPMNLSEQQILDCGPRDTGCNGGFSEDVYRVAMREGGLASEKDYPYKASRQHCKSFCFKKTAWIGGFKHLSRNEKAMTSYLGTKGTITVYMNSTLLKYYRNQVIHPRFNNCDTRTNHAVLLVGYSEDEQNMPYWIVKNSWGKNWGEHGFFRIHRGKNVCGIESFPMTAIVDYPGHRKIPCPT